MLVKAEREAVEAAATPRGPLFLEKGAAIDRFQENRLMKKYCALAVIPRRKAHMHALKHSCGTHLSAREPDIVAIKDHLGHEMVASTMKYVAVANARRDEFAKRLKRWK